MDRSGNELLRGLEKLPKASELSPLMIYFGKFVAYFENALGGRLGIQSPSMSTVQQIKQRNRKKANKGEEINAKWG